MLNKPNGAPYIYKILNDIAAHKPNTTLIRIALFSTFPHTFAQSLFTKNLQTHNQVSQVTLNGTQALYKYKTLNDIAAHKSFVYVSYNTFIVGLALFSAFPYAAIKGWQTKNQAPQTTPNQTLLLVKNHLPSSLKAILPENLQIPSTLPKADATTGVKPIILSQVCKFLGKLGPLPIVNTYLTYLLVEKLSIADEKTAKAIAGIISLSAYDMAGTTVFEGQALRNQYKQMEYKVILETLKQNNIFPSKEELEYIKNSVGRASPYLQILQEKGIPGLYQGFLGMGVRQIPLSSVLALSVLYTEGWFNNNTLTRAAFSMIIGAIFSGALAPTSAIFTKMIGGLTFTEAAREIVNNPWSAWKAAPQRALLTAGTNFFMALGIIALTNLSSIHETAVEVQKNLLLLEKEISKAPQNKLITPRDIVSEANEPAQQTSTSLEEVTSKSTTQNKAPDPLNKTTEDKSLEQQALIKPLEDETTQQILPPPPPSGNLACKLRAWLLETCNRPNIEEVMTFMQPA